MKTFPTVAAAALTMSSAFAAEPQVFESGETPATLIELFSSEGCSSCPPAETWISSLKTKPELWKAIVPVVFHVEYWDNLGWADRFASRGFSERQRRYANEWRSDSIYTPGFVVNGLEWRGWFDREPLPAERTAKAGKLRVTLRDRTHLDVVYTPGGETPKTAIVEVALLGGDLASDVQRGENSGHRLLHDFVALNLATAALEPGKGQWNDDSGAQFTGTITLPEKTIAVPNALAAWVKTNGGSAPVQATGGWLKNP